MIAIKLLFLLFLFMWFDACTCCFYTIPANVAFLKVNFWDKEKQSKLASHRRKEKIELNVILLFGLDFENNE